ncbi:MAG: PCRF domain-containing protein, partial [Anaerolineae bacterium]
MERRQDELTAASGEPSLWEDPEHARGVMRQLNAVREDIELWRGMERRLADALELGELVDQDGDDGMIADLAREADQLAREIDSSEATLLFAGDYDDHDAVLSIHAGAGGTESQDWAQMLQRMYTRWAEGRGFDVEVVSTTSGEEAGIKSTTLRIKGRRAYGWLRSEVGIHRLVRISPFDAQKRRHTSFASVGLLPDIGDRVE